MWTYVAGDPINLRDPFGLAAEGGGADKKPDVLEAGAKLAANVAISVVNAGVQFLNALARGACFGGCGAGTLQLPELTLFATTLEDFANALVRANHAGLDNFAPVFNAGKAEEIAAHLGAEQDDLGDVLRRRSFEAGVTIETRQPSPSDLNVRASIDWPGGTDKPPVIYRDRETSASELLHEHVHALQGPSTGILRQPSAKSLQDYLQREWDATYVGNVAALEDATLGLVPDGLAQTMAFVGTLLWWGESTTLGEDLNGAALAERGNEIRFKPEIIEKGTTLPNSLSYQHQWAGRFLNRRGYEYEAE